MSTQNLMLFSKYLLIRYYFSFLPSVIDRPSGSSSIPFISASGISPGDSDSEYNPNKRRKKTKQKKKRYYAKKSSIYEKKPKKSKKNPY